MFTGIITGQGVVREATRAGASHDMRAIIKTPPEFLAAQGGTAIGASIACSGCCLTVTALGPDWFAVDVSGESVARTTLGGWQTGTRINLERALRLGDELGGHMVSGHVDGLGTWPASRRKPARSASRSMCRPRCTATSRPKGPSPSTACR